VLDLGCGIGYSTLWLASAAGDGARVGRIEFVCGTVIDVLSDMRGPVDAIHDDAWFAPPDHLEAMIALLRPGGLLTMPNWFLLVDAITGEARNDWEQFAGPTWAADTIAYAELLAQRNDICVSWIIRPPLGVAVTT
jgi:predicted O-methyltransferase YrrM